MAKWTVKVKVCLDETLEFEREVEASTNEEAEYLAEEMIDEDDLFEKMKECDVFAKAYMESKAVAK